LSDPKFNTDLFSASLLVLDDKTSKPGLDERRERIGAIKSLIWNRNQRRQGKGTDAIDLMLSPFWRMVIAGNWGAGIHIAPALDQSLEDKIILLKTIDKERIQKAIAAGDLPRNDAEQEIWAKKLKQELPAYAHFLMTFNAEGKKDPRTGCVNFWHPTIKHALAELQPEMRLLEMIDNLRLVSVDSVGLGGRVADGCWQGTASEFEQAMRALDRDGDGKKSGMTDRIFYNGQRAGAMLTELDTQSRRVVKTNRGNTSYYFIFNSDQTEDEILVHRRAAPDDGQKSGDDAA
jgi:hypothetical protein